MARCCCVVCGYELEGKYGEKDKKIYIYIYIYIDVGDALKKSNEYENKLEV